MHGHHHDTFKTTHLGPVEDDAGGCMATTMTRFKTTHLGPVEDDAGGRLELTEVQSTVQHRLVRHHPGWFHPTVGADDHLGLEPGRNPVCQMSTAKQMKMLVTSGPAASIYRACQKYQ